MFSGPGRNYHTDAEEARKRGAYLRPLGDVVYVTPSLNIPDGDLDALLAIVRESVEASTP